MHHADSGYKMQAVQASTLSESLGDHVGCEAGTAPGDLEDDYSVIAPSEASSAAMAAAGVTKLLCCFAA